MVSWVSRDSLFVLGYCVMILNQQAIPQGNKDVRGDERVGVVGYIIIIE